MFVETIRFFGMVLAGVGLIVGAPSLAAEPSRQAPGSSSKTITISVSVRADGNKSATPSGRLGRKCHSDDGRLGSRSSVRLNGKLNESSALCARYVEGRASTMTEAQGTRYAIVVPL